MPMTATQVATYVSGFCTEPNHNHKVCGGFFNPYGLTPALVCHCPLHDGEPRRASGSAAHVSTAPVSVPEPVKAKVAVPVKVQAPVVSTAHTDGPTPGELRAWARSMNIRVGERGRIGPEVRAAYAAAH